MTGALFCKKAAARVGGDPADCDLVKSGIKLYGEVIAMVYQGTVQNGVVVIENGIRLPEGIAVRVEPLSKEPSEQAETSEDDPLLNMSAFAVDMGPTDLSVNIDHYLYGHPKATDGQ